MKIILSLMQESCRWSQSNIAATNPTPLSSTRAVSLWSFSRNNIIISRILTQMKQREIQRVTPALCSQYKVFADLHINFRGIVPKVKDTQPHGKLSGYLHPYTDEWKLVSQFHQCREVVKFCILLCSCEDKAVMVYGLPCMPDRNYSSLAAIKWVAHWSLFALE